VFENAGFARESLSQWQMKVSLESAGAQRERPGAD
jgi:hypothetical protein